jgi:hypothetical protein
MSETKVSDQIKDLIRKVNALAEAGYRGEAENAKKILSKLLAKHNLKIEDLLGPNKTRRTFKPKNEQEKKILVQCLFKYANWNGEYYTSKSKKTQLQVEMTDVEYVDVVEAYNHYLKAFKKELETFTLAFITSNKIFSNRKDDRDVEFSEEEIQQYRKAAMMSMGIKSSDFIPKKRQLQS